MLATTESMQAAIASTPRFVALEKSDGSPTEPDPPAVGIDERAETVGRSHAHAPEVFPQLGRRLVAAEDRLQVTVIPRQTGRFQGTVEYRLRRWLSLNAR